MTAGTLSREDALTVRAMLDWPGGLELHIGVKQLRFVIDISGAQHSVDCIWQWCHALVLLCCIWGFSSS